MMKKINRLNKIVSLLLITGLVICPVNAFALTKKETVFTNLDSNGKVIKNIVNNNLSFIDDETEDETILKDILNISGDEKITSKDNKITFKTDDKDLTYQGVTTKELPIDVNIKYFLNDEKVSIKSLNKKKGHVTISINLENNLYDEDYGLHIPFVVTSALIIKGDQNSNIKVSNGKVINTGTRNIAVSVAAPGLYEDLGIDKLDSLDEITIDYDTKSFEQSDIYLVASPKLLSSIELEKLDELNSLGENVNKLEDGMNKLEDGSKKLAKGTKDLNKGTKKLRNGLKAALDGSNSLKDGSKEVDDNLNKIISGLNDSKSTLDKKSKKLIGKINEINELKENNNNAITNLTNANSMIVSNVSSVNPNLDVTSSSFNETVSSLLNAGVIDEATYKTLVGLKTQYDGNIGLITLLEINNGTIDTLVASLTTTSGEISNSLDTLSSYLTELETQGTSAIANGQKDLNEGLLKLYNGSKDLSNGSKKLKTGSKELATGIEKVNEEGISKLTSMLKLVNEYTDKVKKLVTLSKNYKGYASSNSDEVTFIFKVNQ